MKTRIDFLKRLRELPGIVSGIRSASYIPGSHRSRVKMGGHEFERTAPFIPGEHDLRQYAHRLSAKMGKPMRVIKSETKENLFVSLVDLRPSLSFGKTRTKREFALEIAGALGLTALALDDRASVSALGLARQFVTGKGGRSKDAFLFSLLSLHAYRKTTDFSEMTESIVRASRLLPASSSVFVISDWLFSPQPNETCPLNEQQAYCQAQKALKALSVDHEVGVVALHDIRDFTLPEGVYRISNGAGGAAMIAKSAKANKALTRLFEERRTWLDGLTRNLGIDYCLLETDETFKYISKLLTFFAKRKVR